MRTLESAPRQIVVISAAVGRRGDCGVRLRRELLDVRPFVKILLVLVENLHSTGVLFSGARPSVVVVDRDTMRQIELARSLALGLSRQEELAVLVEFDNAQLTVGVTFSCPCDGRSTKLFLKHDTG